jgi:SAM-dependent methyltransferase
MPWGSSHLDPSPTWQPFPPVPDTLALLQPGAVIVDLGAGGRRITPGTIAIDYSPYPGTNVCSDAHRLGLRDASVDCVFSTGTFEHIADPPAALAEIRRVLKPGGLVHLEVPFVFPFHPDPLDNTRWTAEGLASFCARHGFEKVRQGTHMGPASALNMVLIEYARCWFEGRVMRRLAYLALAILLTPHRYLDRFLIRRRYASYLAAGVYYVGRKP